jgi:hypothetical protein
MEERMASKVEIRVNGLTEPAADHVRTATIMTKGGA